MMLLSAPSAGAAVLHDQYDNFGAPTGFVSNEGAAPNQASELADDFTVPAGQTWSLSSVEVRGNNSVPPHFNLAVYANASALPGAVVTARPVAAAATTNATDYTATISPPIDLQPGTYWIGVQGGDNGWGWVETNLVRGAIAAWRAEYFAPCITFHTKGTCGGADMALDQAFRLNGTSTPIPIQPAAKKKCKKGFRLKTVKKKGKKRKKCVKRKKRKRRG